MLSLLRRLRYVLRIRRIAVTLTRHGLGWLADQAGLSRFLAWPGRLLRGEPAEPLPSLAQRLCLALQELGLPFVLLGRYLSTRVDLLPVDLCRELRCLALSGPPLTLEEVGQVVQQELGRPVGELFAEFAAQPWRSTWIEQVHKARTTEGQDVWVTVSNEQTRVSLEQERPVLQELALILQRNPPPGRRWPALEVVRQFEEVVRQEFDLCERGRNAERWQRQFADQDQIVFPTVDWKRTAAHVLTCQALPGLSLEAIADGAEVSPSPPSKQHLAQILYGFFAQAIFQNGSYPAPPSLGALVVQENGQVAVTTTAPVGYIDSSVRRDILLSLEHFQAEAIGGIIDKAASLALIGRRDVSAAVYQAVRHLIERYHDLPLSEIRLRGLSEDIFSLAGREVIDLPEELSLLLRTLVAVESLGRRLAPEVDAAQAIAPPIRQAIAAQHSWQVRQERLLRSGRAWVEALGTLPLDLRHLLSQAVQGDLLLGVEPRGWQKPMRRLERMVYRLVLSVVAAGLLIALAMLVTALLPPSWGPWGWILAGLALFSLLGLGFLLFVSFLRRG